MRSKCVSPVNDNSQKSSSDDLLPEYNFDYRQARPNRFVRKNVQPSVTVNLDDDGWIQDDELDRHLKP